MDTWQKNHSFLKCDLFACAACGIRQAEEPKRKFDYYYLREQLEVLKYSVSDKALMINWMEAYELNLPSLNDGNVIQLNHWKACSAYYDEE